MKDLLETLADLEHQQWMSWAKAVYPEVSEVRQKRWRECFVPYSKLSEEMKEHDRKWGRKVMELFKTLYRKNCIADYKSDSDLALRMRQCREALEKDPDNLELQAKRRQLLQEYKEHLKKEKVVPIDTARPLGDRPEHHYQEVDRILNKKGVLTQREMDVLEDELDRIDEIDDPLPEHDPRDVNRDVHERNLRYLKAIIDRLEEAPVSPKPSRLALVKAGNVTSVMARVLARYRVVARIMTDRERAQQQQHTKEEIKEHLRQGGKYDVKHGLFYPTPISRHEQPQRRQPKQTEKAPQVHKPAKKPVGMKTYLDIVQKALEQKGWKVSVDLVYEHLTINDGKNDLWVPLAAFDLDEETGETHGAFAWDSVEGGDEYDADITVKNGKVDQTQIAFFDDKLNDSFVESEESSS